METKVILYIVIAYVVVTLIGALEKATIKFLEINEEPAPSVMMMIPLDPSMMPPQMIPQKMSKPNTWAKN
jgi:hypothetical protein